MGVALLQSRSCRSTWVDPPCPGGQASCQGRADPAPRSKGRHQWGFEEPHSSTHRWSGVWLWEFACQGSGASAAVSPVKNGLAAKNGFVKAWVTASNMTAGKEWLLAANQAWMESSERAAKLYHGRVLFLRRGFPPTTLHYKDHYRAALKGTCGGGGGAGRV